MSRRRHTPEQIIRKLAEGQKLLAGDMSVCGDADLMSHFPGCFSQHIGVLVRA